MVARNCLETVNSTQHIGHSDIVYNCKGQIVLMFSKNEGVIQVNFEKQRCAYVLFFMNDLFIHEIKCKDYSEITSLLKNNSYSVFLDASKISFYLTVPNREASFDVDRLYVASKLWIGERPHKQAFKFDNPLKPLLPIIKLTLNVIFKQSNFNYIDKTKILSKAFKMQLKEVPGIVVHFLDRDTAVLFVKYRESYVNVMFNVQSLYVNGERCGNHEPLAKYINIGMTLNCNANKLAAESVNFVANCVWIGRKPSHIELFKGRVPNITDIARLFDTITYIGIVVSLSTPDIALLLTSVRKKKAYVIMEVQCLSLDDCELDAENCIDDYVELTDIVYFNVYSFRNYGEFYIAKKAWLPIKVEINGITCIISNDPKLKCQKKILERVYKEFVTLSKEKNIMNGREILKIEKNAVNSFLQRQKKKYFLRGTRIPTIHEVDEEMLDLDNSSLKNSKSIKIVDEAHREKQSEWNKCNNSGRKLFGNIEEIQDISNEQNLYKFGTDKATPVCLNGNKDKTTEIQEFKIVSKSKEPKENLCNWTDIDSDSGMKKEITTYVSEMDNCRNDIRYSETKACSLNAIIGTDVKNYAKGNRKYIAKEYSHEESNTVEKGLLSNEARSFNYSQIVFNTPSKCKLKDFPCNILLWNTLNFTEDKDSCIYWKHPSSMISKNLNDRKRKSSLTVLPVFQKTFAITAEEQHPKEHYLCTSCRLVAVDSKSSGVLCFGQGLEADFLKTSLRGIEAEKIDSKTDLCCIASRVEGDRYAAWLVWYGDSSSPEITEYMNLLSAQHDDLEVLAANALYGSHVTALSPHAALLAVKIHHCKLPVILPVKYLNENGRKLSPDYDITLHLKLGQFVEVKVRKIRQNINGIETFHWEASDARKALPYSVQLMKLKEISYKGVLRKSVMISADDSRKKKKTVDHCSNADLLQGSKHKTAKVSSQYDDPHCCLKVQNTLLNKRTEMPEGIRLSNISTDMSIDSGKKENLSGLLGNVESVCCWYAMICCQIGGKAERIVCYKNSVVNDDNVPLEQLLPVGTKVRLNVQLLSTTFQGVIYQATNVTLAQLSIKECKSKVSCTESDLSKANCSLDTYKSCLIQNDIQAGRNKSTVGKKSQVAKVKPLVHSQLPTISRDGNRDTENETLVMWNNTRQHSCGVKYVTGQLKCQIAKLKMYLNDSEGILEASISDTIRELRFSQSVVEITNFRQQVCLKDLLVIGEEVYYDALVKHPVGLSSASEDSIIVTRVWKARKQKPFILNEIKLVQSLGQSCLEEGYSYKATVVEIRPPFAFVVQEKHSHEKIFVFNRVYRPGGVNSARMLPNQPVMRFVTLGNVVFVTVHRNTPQRRHQFEWCARNAWPVSSDQNSQHQKGEVMLVQKSWGLLSTSSDIIMFNIENTYLHGTPITRTSLKEIIKKGDVLCFTMTSSMPGNRCPEEASTVILHCRSC